jgi:hypothetical protein
MHISALLFPLTEHWAEQHQARYVAIRNPVNLCCHAKRLESASTRRSPRRSEQAHHPSGWFLWTTACAATGPAAFGQRPHQRGCPSLRLPSFLRQRVARSIQQNVAEHFLLRFEHLDDESVDHLHHWMPMLWALSPSRGHCIPLERGQCRPVHPERLLVSAESCAHNGTKRLMD